MPLCFPTAPGSDLILGSTGDFSKNHRDMPLSILQLDNGKVDLAEVSVPSLQCGISKAAL